jgi:hypothetical protein
MSLKADWLAELFSLILDCIYAPLGWLDRLQRKLRNRP